MKRIYVLGLLFLCVAPACHKNERQQIEGFWVDRHHSMILRHAGSSLRIDFSGTYIGDGPFEIQVGAAKIGVPVEYTKFHQTLTLSADQLGSNVWCRVSLPQQCSIQSWHVEESGALPKMIVFGIDGATWRVLGKLVKENRVPHFQKLMNQGSYGILDSVEDSESPVVWTTIATGKNPDQHGIHDFLDGDRRPVQSMEVRVKRIWDIISDNSSLTTGVLGWYVTWPVDTVSGFMISDRAFQNQYEQSFSPAELVQPFQEAWKERGENYWDEVKRFTSFPLDPDFRHHRSSPLFRQNELLSKRLLHVYFRDSLYLESGLHFYQLFDPDILFLYVRGVDYTQHIYWQYMDPSETFLKPSEQDRAYYKDIIENYYVYLDQEIGKYMDLADRNTTFIVISDHGFQPMRKWAARDLSGAHEKSGVYIFSGPAFQKDFHHDSISILDICPLLLQQLKLPVAKDMPGKVPMEVLRNSDTAPTFIASYGPRSTNSQKPLASKVDGEIMDQLRTLGYINN